jgi:acetolactate synthase-1/2/3 large subunit
MAKKQITSRNIEGPMKGSEAIVKCLIEEGVDYIYGYPGGAIMPVYDSLYYYQEEIKHILTRHEQGATHAAQGFARATGKVGVCIATSGPGATNLITGIADAMIDSTPLVAITGQVASHLLGSDAFQETDVIGISMPVTKWNIQVTEAKDIPAAMAKAFHIARSGRPGPVLVDITKDAQFGIVKDFKYEKCKGIRSYTPPSKPKDSDVQLAADIINKAKKPFIIFGQGVTLSKSEKELKELVEKANIPAAWTIMGLSAMPTDHPLNVGMVGMHGNYAPNIQTNKCDVLIAIGMRFDDRITGRLEDYATQAKVIHIEIDPAEINKNIHADVPVLGDAKKILKKLLPLINETKHTDWVNEFKDLRKKEDNIYQSDLYPTKGGLTMGEVIRRINENTKGDAILVTDVGQHQMIAIRYTEFNKTLSNITSGGLGTMGFCLPAAIGAKMGKPDREVVAVIGDAGFQMTIQELGTIMQTKTAVKIVILNNNFLGMVRQWQQLFFEKRYSSTEMNNPDFIKITEGYGIKAEKVTERKNLDSAVKRMIDSKESYLLEVVVEKEGNVFPMIPTGASVSEIRLK